MIFSYCYLALLVIHILYSAGPGRQPSTAVGASPEGTTVPNVPLTPISALIHAPLFVMACYYGLGEGAWSRQLVSPLYIGLGLALGHIIFALSLALVHCSVREGAEILVDVRDLWRFMWDSPFVLSRFLTVAVSEEVVWRVAAQPLMIVVLAGFLGTTGGAVAGIGIVAVLFAVTHEHFFKNTRSVNIEFLLFSISLGWLYYATSSLALVIIIHAIRDIEIAYLEYCVKWGEWGDRQRAVDFIEDNYSMVSYKRS